MKEMTLGQYYNGDSLLHRMDPRVKLFGVLAMIVALFSAESLWCFLFLFVLSAALILISGIPAGMLLRGLRPLILILVFTSFHSSLEADTRWHGLAQGWGWERLATLQVVPQIITPTTAPGLLPVLCP